MLRFFMRSFDNLLVSVVISSAWFTGACGQVGSGAEEQAVCNGLNFHLAGRWIRIEGTTGQLPDWFELRAIGSTGGLCQLPGFDPNEYLEYALSVDCDAILLIDGNGDLFRTWHVILTEDTLFVDGPFGRTSVYARHEGAGPLVALLLERQELWGDGKEEVQVLISARDRDGVPLIGVEVSLSSSLDAVRILPGPQLLTDMSGQAHFAVAAQATGAIPLSAGLVGAPAIGATTSLKGVRRHAVILVQGISTQLLSVLPFPELRAKIASLGFVRPPREQAEPESVWEDGLDSDGDGVVDDGGPLILDYSYRGGVILPQTGQWVPSIFHCWDTGQSIQISVNLLHDMVGDYATAHPNTMISVIGHSQGGLIALQSLEMLSASPLNEGAVALECVVTLDGALGGNPNPGLTITEWFQCWGDAAADDLGRTWESASDHEAQGSTATFGSRMHRALVELGHLGEVRTLTLGGFDDCVFSPFSCGLPFSSNLTSQVVDSADWEFFRLGGNCVDLNFDCLKESHSRILSDPGVLARVGSFLGPPVLP